MQYTIEAQQLGAAETEDWFDALVASKDIRLLNGGMYDVGGKEGWIKAYPGDYVIYTPEALDEDDNIVVYRELRVITKAYFEATAVVVEDEEEP